MDETVDMEKPIPLIKGMFVMSHVNALRSAKGETAVKELERRLGKPAKYDALENVPVREEVRIIEIALDLLSTQPLPRGLRKFEAGRLHFKNFKNTSYGKLTLSAASSTPLGFKQLMLRARYIARYIFQNTNFTAIDAGENCLIIEMENNDYHIDHFRGLFYEWMIYWDIKEPMVSALTVRSRHYRYTLRW